MFKAWSDEREWYEFSDVNIFIGANGSGKSTVLELIDFLQNPERVITLSRENKTANSLTAFHLRFGSGSELIGNVTSNLIDGQAVAANIDQSGGDFDSQFVHMVGAKSGQCLFRFARNISKTDLDIDSNIEIAAAFLQLDVETTFWSPETRITETELVAELNCARAHLGGILSEADWSNSNFPPGTEANLQYKKSTPFQRHDERRVAIFLSDDSGQHNNVHVNALPAGWRQLAKILSWLRQSPEGAVCLIEEPETHLHPNLQRYLARQMTAIATERQLQLFISTHSSVFQQLTIWPDATTIFEARPERLAKLNSAWRVLDALGIKGSDISQSNGVIWVEGASDRLYIKHWLKLFCHANKLIEPVENVAYSFSTYGGAALAHFSIDETSSFIDMIGINRNMVMVMDRDNDFSTGKSGELVCTNRRSAKARILEELASFNSSKCHAWVTDAYTIECYLPEAFQAHHFSTENGRLVLKKHRKKVAVATQYVKHHFVLENCTSSPEKLFSHIERLWNAIRAWDH